MKFHNDGSQPQNGEIFVFGGNLAGNHAGGAARCAAEQFGAQAGVAVGLMGQSYAIPTVSESIEQLPLEEIAVYARKFLEFARNNELRFFVTRIGCGIAGFSDDQIAPMFSGAPDNCSFPEEWAHYLARKVVAYKAFDKDLKCRDFQYAVGKTYEHSGKVNACEAGFHACENPLDVLNYYDLCDSRFAVVDLSGELSRKGEDTKIAAAKITITAELSLPKFVDAAIDWVKQACNIEKPDFSKAAGDNSQQASSGDNSQQASSGNYSQQASSGYNSKQASSGYNSKQASSGYNSQQASSGDNSQQASSGNYSQQASSGYNSKQASSGYKSQQASSGYKSQQASSGDNSKHEANGRSSIAVAAGLNSIAKAGELGCFVLTRWVESDKRYRVSVGYVGENIKADTFYKLDDNGNFVEVKQ